MIVIAVEFVVESEHADTFRARVLEHAANSLREPGCARFDVAEDVERPGRFFLWENYVDMAAFDHHKAQPYLAQFRDAIDPIVRKRELRICEMVAAGS